MSPERPTETTFPGAHLLSSCALVVVAAGTGMRFGGFKQLAPIAGKPLLVHTLLAFSPFPFAERIVVLPEVFLSDATWSKLTAEYPPLDQFLPVAGGAERSLSVLAGLQAARTAPPYVAVHDGARPFPPMEATCQCLRLLDETPGIAAAIVSAPMTDTVKRLHPASDEIAETLPRDHLRRAETPQVARIPLLLKALRDSENRDALDEAQVLEHLGHPTACITHSALNLKITHHDDIAIAETILRQRSHHLD